MSEHKFKSENNNAVAMNSLEIIKTNKSREKLIHCNYMYTIHKSAGARTRWRCVARARHCRGAVTTLRDCNNKVTSLNINIGHNHPPNMRAVEQAQLKFSLAPPIILGNSSVSSNIKPSAPLNNTVVNNNAMLKQQQTAATTTIKQHGQQTPPAHQTSVSEEPLVSLPSDVCLRWNSYHSNMQQSFPMLLDSEQFVDVTLACEGQFIKCHKMVLSACSSFFAELFQQNPCQHPVIVLRGSRMWEIRALVDFMYRGEVNVRQDRLTGLLAAAEELQVKGLAGSCTRVPHNVSSPRHQEHATEEGQQHQISLQNKKILKRKAAYPQYNEARAQNRLATTSLPKMKIKAHNFADMMPENIHVSDNTINSTKTTKIKSYVNQNISDRIVGVKDECTDSQDHDGNLEEILNFDMANCIVNDTGNINDDHISSKYNNNDSKQEIDPLQVKVEANEIEENIEEVYD